MNREIKFRGLRDTESGDIEMVYGQVSMDNNHHCSYYETHPDRIHWRTAGGAHASAPVKKGTVGQYIGLKDKNGVEIYCGDIVGFKADYTYNNGYKIGVFVWSEARLQYLISVPNIDHLYNITETDEFNNKSEVLGNIHQNPELLNS